MKKFTSIPNLIFNITAYFLCFLTSLTCIFNTGDLLLRNYIEANDVFFVLIFLSGIIVSLLIGHLLYRLLGWIQRIG